MIREQPILDQDDVEASSEKVKLHIETAANEALGKRRINKNSNKLNTSWFMPEVKPMERETRETYLRYLNNKTPQEWIRYKEIRRNIQGKNRKAPGINKLNNELIKYGGKPLSEQLANLYQKQLYQPSRKNASLSLSSKKATRNNQEIQEK